MGFEPTIPRTTTWCFNQLSYTHRIGASANSATPAYNFSQFQETSLGKEFLLRKILTSLEAFAALILLPGKEFLLRKILTSLEAFAALILLPWKEFLLRKILFLGDSSEIRTPDTWIKSPVLYRLS